MSEFDHALVDMWMDIAEFWLVTCAKMSSQDARRVYFREAMDVLREYWPESE